MIDDSVPESELNLKGWRKYFNSYTLRGRFNCVVTTYATIFSLIFLYKLRKHYQASPIIEEGPKGEPEAKTMEDDSSVQWRRPSPRPCRGD